MTNCTNRTQAGATRKPNDVVWATSVRETVNRAGKYAVKDVEPTKGILAAEKTAEMHNFRVANYPDAAPRYFVPLTPTGRPSWRKAVHVQSLTLADTWAEAAALHDAEIQRLVAIHTTIIDELTRHLASPDPSLVP